jgi:hypothetical protein
LWMCVFRNVNVQVGFNIGLGEDRRGECRLKV